MRDETQIHTHMCYSEFNDIIGRDRGDGRRRDLDRDGAQPTWSCWRPSPAFAYPNEIGPGVWDIHSPRVPGAEEMARCCGRARRSASRAERLWLNPDCGCKTRGWAEVKPAVENLVAAARRLRAELA